jgi:hypothetical protein
MIRDKASNPERGVYITVFRLIGKLLRAWEIYTFIRDFSPMGYAMDKAFQYVFERMRTSDWVFVSLSGLLILVWMLELLNWAVQLVLGVLSWTGVWHGVWPAWPALWGLAHPTFGRLVGWLLSGVLLLGAILTWLLHFLPRLWPGQRIVSVSAVFTSSGAAPGSMYRTARWSTPDEAQDVDAKRATSLLPSGTGLLTLAWLLQALVLM